MLMRPVGYRSSAAVCAKFHATRSLPTNVSKWICHGELGSCNSCSTLDFSVQDTQRKSTMDMAVLSEISANLKSLSPMPAREKIRSEPDTSLSSPSRNLTPMERFGMLTPPTMPNSSSRQASPTPSTLSSISSKTCSTLKAVDPLGSGPPPAKRRKYTAEEKEQQKLEKEEKQRKRIEEKAKRDEEKIVKDEEKRQKNEAREEKKREKELQKQQKEAEKQEKEDEKRRKEDEKLKKENAQKRINSFFVKPITPSKPKNAPPTSSQPDDENTEDKLQDSPAATSTSPQNVAPAETKPKSDYSTYFLPFSLPSNSVWAPSNRFTWDESAVKHFEDSVTKSFQSESGQVPHTLPVSSHLLDLLNLPEVPTRGLVLPSIKEIMDHVNGTISNPIDLTEPSSFWDKPMDLLKLVPLKHICFQEDVRPPYIGTYTKIRTRSGVLNLSRNPFKRLRPDTNYDYDSEAEWEDPGEGEDLDSEGESEAESGDEAEDLEGFLDDEDDTALQAQRRRPVGDLEPICSGLCWEDTRGKCHRDAEDLSGDLSGFRLEVIEGYHKMPIDPFSVSYWNDDVIGQGSDISAAKVGLMDPPKHPLQARANNVIGTLKASRGRPPKSSSNVPMSKRGPAKLLVGSELEEFKKAVEGSDLTKLGIIEVLKKKFPKTPKESLKDTLNSVAARVGVKDADKRWVIIDSSPARLTQPTLLD